MKLCVYYARNRYYKDNNSVTYEFTSNECNIDVDKVLINGTRLNPYSTLTIPNNSINIYYPYTIELNCDGRYHYKFNLTANLKYTYIDDTELILSKSVIIHNYFSSSYGSYYIGIDHNDTSSNTLTKFYKKLCINIPGNIYACIYDEDNDIITRTQCIGYSNEAIVTICPMSSECYYMDFGIFN